ncbi:glycosyltransferase [Vibrio parahaemolyticus]
MKKLIIESKLFDSNFYSKEYSELNLNESNALEHYINFGIFENKKPNRNFDPLIYIEKYSDVKFYDGPAFIHFINHGIEEGRDCNLLEVTGLNYSDVLDINLLEKEDYSDDGIKIGKYLFHDDYETFNEDVYLDLHSDVRIGIEDGSFESGYEHFCKFGFLEIRDNKRYYPRRKKKVSIVCVTYNHEKYIRKTIEGFLSQDTSFELEIIISDDSSTDNTPLIIDEYHKKHPDLIKPLYNDINIGPRNNFMQALSAATGSYVALCEGDDWWIDKEKIQKQGDFLDKNKDYSICFHPVKVIKNEIEYTGDYPFEEIPETTTIDDLVKRNYIQTNSVMYRWMFGKTGVNKDNFNINAMPGDWYLHMLHAKHGLIKQLNDTMSVYNLNDGGIWGSYHGDAIGLHRKHGIKEIELFRTINLELDRKYEDLFDKKIESLFILLFEEYIDSNEFDKAYELYATDKVRYNSVLNSRQVDLSNYVIDDGESLKNAIKKENKVSVIITSYNQENYIVQAIDSVIKQEGCFDIELIVGDDCSTDKTSMIIEEYKEKYPELIHVIDRKVNVGMLTNMKECLSHASGKYIAFCEGDDYWITSSRLRKLVSFMRKNADFSMCFNSLLLYKEDNDSYSPHSGQMAIKGNRISHDFLFNNPVTANFSACLYRSSVVKKINPEYFEMKGSADWLFNLICSMHGDIGFFNEFLSVYRVHDKGQWSKLSRSKMLDNMQIAKQKHLDFFGRKNNLLPYYNRPLMEDELGSLRFIDKEKDFGIDYYLDNVSINASILNVKGWILKCNGNDLNSDKSGLLLTDVDNNIVYGHYFKYTERKDLLSADRFKGKTSDNSTFGINLIENLDVLKGDSFSVCIVSGDYFFNTEYVITRKLNSFVVSRV